MPVASSPRMLPSLKAVSGRRLTTTANLAGMGPLDPRFHDRFCFPRQTPDGTKTDVVYRESHNEEGTPMGRTCTVGIMTVGIMTVAIASASTARAGDELPRYRLEPGMELSYKGSSTFGHQNGMHIDDQESTAWIVRRNGDGSVHVVVRQGSRFTATSVVDTLKSLSKNKPSRRWITISATSTCSPTAAWGRMLSWATVSP